MDTDENLIRCSTQLDNGEVCGWFAFDEVTLFTSNKPNAQSPITAYSCRSCGYIQQRSVSAEIYSKLYAKDFDADASASIWKVKIGVPNVRAIENAIKNGADVNETSENDYTLLMCAAQNGAIENVLCLLINGSGPLAVSLGKTASQLARDENEHEIADVIDAYIQKQSNRKRY